VSDIPKFFHQNDPQAPEVNYVWHWVYLHGAAEQYNMEVALGFPVDRDDLTAPDLFVSDQPMPTEPGLYMASLYGRDVVVCLAYRLGDRNWLCGRAAILTTRGDAVWHLQHALSPEEWR
jgi:hypothetical protein